VTPWTRLDGRARSAAAVLLAAVAVVGSLLAGPSAATQVTGAAAAQGAAARGAAPAGVALREHRDVARAALRRGARESSAPRADASVGTAVGHGPAPAALLVAALLLVALTVAGRLAGAAESPLRRRTAAARRDRAPPALALA
jgi:hypothetical protein